MLFHEEFTLLMSGIKDTTWSAIRKNWTTLAQIAALVMTVVATIATPPPTPVGTPGIRPFASFIVAILAAICLLALRRFRKQKHAGLWAGVAAILLALTVLNYFWYGDLIDTRTQIWHEHTIICGTQLQAEIQKAYGSTISKPFAKKLLDDAAGDPALIWTDQSIRSSKDILCISYLLMVPLIGGCILGASQIAICGTQRRFPMKSAKGNKKKPPMRSP